MDRKDWAHATSIRWESSDSKKRVSSLNFRSFFWAQPLVSLRVIFGHFLVACGKIQPPKCTTKTTNGQNTLRRRNTPRGKTPNGFEAMRHCCRSREQDCGQGRQKGHPCQSRKTASTLGCLFGSSQKYKAKGLKDQKFEYDLKLRMFFDDDWGLRIISFFLNIRCSFPVQNRGFGPLEPPFASPGVQSQERLIGRNGRKKRYQGADELRVHPAVPRGIQFKVRLRKTRMLGKGEAIICLLVETNDSDIL